MNERANRQDLHLETTSRLARLVAATPPGSKLPTERQLCRELAVSRSTLREAVRSLAFMGALEPRQGSGTYVRSPEGGAIDKLIGLALMMQRCSVSEVIEARRILEVEAVRLAARKHDEADRMELETRIEKMRLASDPLTASSYDLQFHVVLARASHNAVLIHFLQGMRGLLNIWIRKAVNRTPVIEEVLREHAAILVAVFARDPDQAAARMYVHLTNAAERLFQVVGPDQSRENYISLLMSGGDEELV